MQPEIAFSIYPLFYGQLNLWFPADSQTTTSIQLQPVQTIEGNGQKPRLFPQGTSTKSIENHISIASIYA